MRREDQILTTDAAFVSVRVFPHNVKLFTVSNEGKYGRSLTSELFKEHKTNVNSSHLQVSSGEQGRVLRGSEARIQT